MKLAMSNLVFLKINISVSKWEFSITMDNQISRRVTEFEQTLATS